MNPNPHTTPLRGRVSAPASAPLPTGPDGLLWRPLTVADATHVHALRRKAGPVDHPSWVITLEEIENNLALHGLDLNSDTLGAFTPAGMMLAYGIVFPPTDPDTVVRVELDGQVAPDRRGEGIGRQLLRWQQARGEQMLAIRDETLPGWLTCNADERAGQTVHLLHHAGFRTRRWWLELRRDLAVPIDDVTLSPAFSITGYTPASAEPVRAASNEAFRDHWGTQPVSREDWDANDELPTTRHDLSFVAWHGADVAGFLTTSVNDEESAQLGFDFGYVDLLGTRPRYRGRSVARALLTTAMTAYRHAGLTHAMLDVDSDSPTGAADLYESVGFRTFDRSVTLVREY